MRKRLVLCFSVLLLLCNLSFAQDKVTYQQDYRFYTDRIEGVYIPKDIDEAIDSIDTFISIEDKRYITDSLSLDDFCVQSHFGLGTWIRNEWGLWSGSRLQKYFSDRKIYHPDDMSSVILMAYYKKKIQGLEYSQEEIIKSQRSSLYKISFKDRLSSIFNGRWWHKRKDLTEKRNMIKEEGFSKGVTVYFSYPYGCSSAEEQEKWNDGALTLPEGRITSIDYKQQRIKVKLMSAASPYGIIVFDGDLFADDEDNYKRDFDTFTINSPNRFYMQVGDELWFDLKSYIWDLEP